MFAEWNLLAHAHKSRNVRVVTIKHPPAVIEGVAAGQLDDWKDPRLASATRNSDDGCRLDAQRHALAGSAAMSDQEPATFNRRQD